MATDAARARIVIDETKCDACRVKRTFRGQTAVAFVAGVFACAMREHIFLCLNHVAVMKAGGDAV